MAKIKQNVVICSRPQDTFGYFGWPSVAVQGDGTVVAVASGLRYTHVCPWGRTVMCKSHDGGLTWTSPLVINNTPLDDRDAGIISLGGQRLAVTWFTSNTWMLLKSKKDPETGKWADGYEAMGAVMDTWQGKMCEENIGSYIRVSPDGEYWGEALQAPVNTPHGFIVLKNGDWLYLGKKWNFTMCGRDTIHIHDAPIQAAVSRDEGRSWELLGTVPMPEGVINDQCHEPHVIELNDGSLLGSVRVHKPFDTMLTRSTDGGRTWSVLEDCGVHGAPAHFLRHSSGAIVMVYGYRMAPFGQRARISTDDGRTWSEDIVLRDDGPCGDLGYPASCELADGSILTVYYQQLQAGEKCSLLGTIWNL